MVVRFDIVPVELHSRVPQRTDDDELIPEIMTHYNNKWFKIQKYVYDQLEVDYDDGFVTDYQMERYLIEHHNVIECVLDHPYHIYFATEADILGFIMKVF